MLFGCFCLRSDVYLFIYYINRTRSTHNKQLISRNKKVALFQSRGKMVKTDYQKSLYVHIDKYSE